LYTYTHGSACLELLLLLINGRPSILSQSAYKFNVKKIGDKIEICHSKFFVLRPFFFLMFIIAGYLFVFIIAEGRKKTVILVSQ
jgi:hypothetical protein